MHCFAQVTSSLDVKILGCCRMREGSLHSMMQYMQLRPLLTDDQQV